MDRARLIHDLHEIAAELTVSGGREFNRSTGGATETGDDSLLDCYHFSSLDALEYLLILEERFGVTFEDEDLNEEILLSVEGLAAYILGQKKDHPVS